MEGRRGDRLREERGDWRKVRGGKVEGGAANIVDKEVRVDKWIEGGLRMEETGWKKRVRWKDEEADRRIGEK